MGIEIVFAFVVLIFSAVIHEVSHGAMAYSLGDPTAKMQGRLTLNPIPHLDLYGSIIMPLIFVLLPGGFFFAYAKPVPYNPYNLNNQRWGPALVAAAGPLSNFILAGGIALLYRLAGLFTNVSDFYSLVYYVVLINIILGVFNAIPIPPLDGSKVLLSFFPRNRKIMEVFSTLERNGMLLVLVFAFFIFPTFAQVLQYVAFWLLRG
jgi:Zn-dependent protease